MRRGFPGTRGGRCGESSGACPEWRRYRPRLRSVKLRSVKPGPVRRGFLRLRKPRTRRRPFRGGWVSRLIVSRLLRLNAEIPNLDIQRTQRVLYYGILARAQRFFGPDLVESARR